MTELLIREQIEIERKRDDHERLDRINGVEKAVAVLQTRFEALLDRLRGAVSDDDLKQLKREVEADMRIAMDSLRAYVDSSNQTQADRILSRVDEMRNADKAEQREERIADMRAVLEQARGTRSRWLWWIMGIVASLVATMGATMIGILLATRA